MKAVSLFKCRQAATTINRVLLQCVQTHQHQFTAIALRRRYRHLSYGNTASPAPYSALSLQRHFTTDTSSYAHSSSTQHQMTLLDPLSNYSHPQPDPSVLQHCTASAASQVTAATLRNTPAFIIDIDGTITWLSAVIPGTGEFIDWLKCNKKKFVFLTNSSERSPRELQEKFARLGIQVSPDNFYTSALATASFLARQKPNSTAYVIGESGLINALYEVGISMNDVDPDWVVVGETRNYNYSMIETAVRLCRQGSRLIGTNCDVVDRTKDSFIPACGSLISPIEMASGRSAYFIGKPNPLIMRAALHKLGVSRKECCIIGDRVDTDILAGLQSEITTCLVLTGVTQLNDLHNFSYRPDVILPSAHHILHDGFEVAETESSLRKNIKQHSHSIINP